ncbi:MAG: hypothetical protein ABIR19_08870 [Ginsengibacter sp.]
MGYADLILFPIFVFLCSLFFRRLRQKYDDPFLRKYHRQGFWIKVIGCLAFTVYNVYISPGDSTGLYHKEGYNIYQLILEDSNHLKWIFQHGKLFDESLLKDPWNKGYFRAEANFMVVRFVAVLSFICLGSYAVVNLIFACIAFTGLWKLFSFFYEQYPQFHKKFAIAILYFPTLVFWSSGIMKDSLCIGALGWITYSVYEMLYRKRGFIKNSIILIVFAYLLGVIKIYILISYLPFFVLFIIFKNMEGVRNRLLRYILAPLLLTGCIYGFSLVLESYEKELGGYAVEDLTNSIHHMNSVFNSMDGRETAESNFDLGVEFDGTFQGLVHVAPMAIFTTFYRPFIWESKKMSSMLASLEGFLLLLFTIYLIFKSGIRMLFRLLLTDPLIMYCFLFSMIFALFVGASTLNFGTLVRYKIPCLPFFIICLFLIHEKVKERSAKKLLKKMQNSESSQLLLSPALS